jgi:Zn-dependent metalloprotease
MTHCYIIPPHLVERLPYEGRALKVRRDFGKDAALRAIRSLIPPDPTLTAATVPANRSIWTADEGWSLPGTLMRDDLDPEVVDCEINRLWEMSGEVLEFLYDIYGWSGVSGAGTDLPCVAHYGDSYANAFWNGELLAIGDGDDVYFTTFLADSTVVAHEIGHGIVQHTAGLEYHGQSGALNESFADVFGVLAEQYALQQEVEAADWLIGEGIFTPTVQGTALRSLKAPGTAYNDPKLGKDPQPSTMAKYVQTSRDNGGVHINSGIPNHAFYLASMSVGGHAWEQTGRVWMDTVLQGRVGSRAGFLAFATATVAAASDRFGPLSQVKTSVERAWQAVGVLAA